ncbi:MAG: hypothetical protein PVF51_05640 [Nitrospirota bacterium]
MKTSSSLAAILLALASPAALFALPSLAAAATTEALGDCVVDDDDETLDCGGESIDVRLDLFQDAIVRLR